MATLELVLVGAALAFLPPLVWLAWVRHSERHHREPWRGLFKQFLWGGTGGVLVAVVLSLALLDLLEEPWAALVPGVSIFAVAAVIVAPLAEEPAKAATLPFVKDAHPEPEDGYIYGAAAGLGFAAVETALYIGQGYIEAGAVGLVAVGIMRSFTAAFLHASASAIAGFGLMRGGGAGPKVRGLALAVLLHAGYNLLASAHGLAGEATESAAFLQGIGLLTALVLAVVVFRGVRRRVAALDAAPRAGTL